MENTCKNAYVHKYIDRHPSIHRYTFYTPMYVHMQRIHPYEIREVNTHHTKRRDSNLETNFYIHRTWTYIYLSKPMYVMVICCVASPYGDKKTDREIFLVSFEGSLSLYTYV